MNQYCAACGSPVPAVASICGRCAHPVGQPPAVSARTIGQLPAAPERPQPEEAKPQAAWIKKLGPFGAIAAAALKFKTVILLVASKALQFKALLSVLAFFGVYWAAYGWRFAAGLVAGIYIHEMGHVWMIRRYGMRATMPMFIPGFGAFVSSPDQRTVAQGARIGLAGPLWGSAAAITFLLLSVSFPSPSWAAIVRVTAVINLFALTPIWIFDGSKGFGALDLRQRLYLVILAALLWYITGEAIFAIFLLGAAYRILWNKDFAPQPDAGALFEFAGLLAVLAAVLALAPAGNYGR